jgi:T3SS negative regulator,GrlR
MIRVVSAAQFQGPCDRNAEVAGGGPLIQGVFAAQFLSNTNKYGEGIVVLDSGRVHGGDLDHVYVGTYSLLDNTFSATVDVANYSGSISSVLGHMAHYRLTLHGIVKKAQDITTHGTVEGRPDLDIQINLHKVSELVRS